MVWLSTALSWEDESLKLNSRFQMDQSIGVGVVNYMCVPISKWFLNLTQEMFNCPRFQLLWGCSRRKVVVYQSSMLTPISLEKFKNIIYSYILFFPFHCYKALQNTYFSLKSLVIVHDDLLWQNRFSPPDSCLSGSPKDCVCGITLCDI